MERWQANLVAMVRDQEARNRFRRLTLPEAYTTLLRYFPTLTLADYHAGLRYLHDANLISLGAWTASLATIPDARNALYLDHAIRFYIG